MKNKFLVLLLALVMVLGAVACSNKKQMKTQTILQTKKKM